MKVVWSPLAIQRAVEAAEVIATDASVRWAEALFESAERLRAHPNSGRMVPEIGRPEVREVIHGSYRVIYRLGPDEVLVLTVRSSRQLLDLGEVE